MTHFHPFKTHKLAKEKEELKLRVDEASGHVATEVLRKKDEQGLDDPFYIEIGPYLRTIGVVRFETMVGADVERKLAELGLKDVVFSPEKTDLASRTRAEGYGNYATDYNRKNLTIVMERIDNVFELGAMSVAAQIPLAETA
jgi:hypothetical protein